MILLQKNLHKGRSELAAELWQDRIATNRKYQNTVSDILSGKIPKYTPIGNSSAVALSHRNSKFNDLIYDAKREAQSIRNHELKQTEARKQLEVDRKIDAERAARKEAERKAAEKAEREAAEKAEKFNKSTKGKVINWVKNNPKTVKGIGIGALGVGALGAGIVGYNHYKNKKKETKQFSEQEKK